MRYTKFLSFFLTLTSTLTFSLFAQDIPHIGYIFPAGGKRDSKFQVVIGGQNLEDVKKVYFSGNGIHSKILRYGAPKSILKKNKAISDRGFLIQDTTVKKDTLNYQKMNPKRQSNVQIEEIITIEINIDKDAELIERNLRVVTTSGISNPLNFQIGDLEEITEKEPNNNFTQANGPFSLPVLLNGQIVAGDADYYKITAAKGDRLYIKAEARSLIPYLADAVPGWFQPALTIYNADRKKVAFADHDKFEPDPIIIYNVPQNGDYFLRVTDAIYRGREDFVYRISIEKNFSVGKIIKLPDTLNYNLPIVNESEPNNNIENAQPVKFPVLIKGIINQPGDLDVYSFKGQKNQMIVAEVIAGRIGSPMDSMIKLIDSTGKVLIMNDDFPDKSEGLITHMTDSYFTYKLPSAGTYFIKICDIQNKGGEDYTYQLRLSAPIPDFKLRLVPSSIVISQGGTGIITVQVLRKEGFNGEINLSLKSGVNGISLDGAVIPANQDQFQLTISLPVFIPLGITTLQIEGTAKIGNKIINRELVPAEEMIQAFSYKHLVPAKEFVVDVTEKAKVIVSHQISGNNILHIPKGGSVDIEMEINRGEGYNEKLKFVLINPPKGITMAEKQITEKDLKTSITIKSNDKESKTGFKGNLIFQVMQGNKKICNVPAVPVEVSF